MPAKRFSHTALGSAMIEFSLVAVVLFTISGAIFDFGLILYRQAQAGKIMRETVRSAAFLNLKCRRLLEKAEQRLSQRLTDEIRRPSRVKARIGEQPLTSGLSYLTLELEAETPMSCYFCRLVPSLSNIKTTGEAVLETTACTFDQLEGLDAS